MGLNLATIGIVAQVEGSGCKAERVSLCCFTGVKGKVWRKVTDFACRGRFFRAESREKNRVLLPIQCIRIISFRIPQSTIRNSRGRFTVFHTFGSAGGHDGYVISELFAFAHFL